MGKIKGVDYASYTLNNLASQSGFARKKQRITGKKKPPEIQRARETSMHQPDIDGERPLSIQNQAYRYI